jgi:AmmeMemoRadiSam system protein B
MNSEKIRSASHAGSWYDSSKNNLDKKLSQWLSQSNPVSQAQLIRGVIAPHAGYEYSGPTAAWSYININKENYDTVFLLGPCHHKYIKGCGLTKCTSYETPLGNIPVDTDILDELAKNKNFVRVEKVDDEEEHSIEMHLPYIKKVFGEKQFKLVPVMVGSIDNLLEEYFGKIFAKYLLNTKNLFVLSSDFCHWGNHFDYTPYDKNDGQIYQTIEKIDKWGIDCITQQDPEKFLDYLKETENTICGRNPIATFLFALKHSGLKTKTSLQYYTQSSQVKKKNDSSVSYASIVTYLDE